MLNYLLQKNYNLSTLRHLPIKMDQCTYARSPLCLFAVVPAYVFPYDLDDRFGPRNIFKCFG